MSVTIASFTFDYSRSGSGGYLRSYADEGFLDPDGVEHPAQAAGGQDYLKEIPFTAASNVATVDTFTHPATWDEASGARSSVTIYILDANRNKVGVLVSGFRIPSLPSTTTWGALRTHNEAAATVRDTRTYTAQQTDYQIAQAAVSGGPASVAALGRLKASAAPSDAAAPVALITDDVNWKNVKGGVFNPKAYGAAVDNVTDDTAAWVLAVAALNANGGGRLIVPEGRSLIGGAAVANYILNLTVPCVVEGFGARSVIVPATGTPATTDVFRVTPAPHVGQQEVLLNSPEDNAGWVFRNFVIRPASGTPARDGIRVDITTPGSFFQNSRFEGLFFGDLGGHSLSFINTVGGVPVNTDGAFNNYILGCVLRGGIFADAFGDSNHVYFSRFWSSVDNTHRALDITFISGAGASAFVGNNLTKKLGSKVVGGTGTLFLGNYAEPFWPGSAGADGACLSIDGGAISPKVWGCTFNGGLGSNTLNGLHLGSVTGATVDGNYFSVPATKYGVNVSASASDTTVTAAQTVTGGGSLMNDAGSGTNVDVFSSSSGRITRVGTAFGSALGASSPITGFAALDAAVLEVNRNAATSTDTKFAALLLSAIQSGTSNLLGVIHFLNTSLAGDDDSVAAFSGSTDGAADSGRLDFATDSAGTSSIKLSIRKNGVQLPGLPVYANNAAALAGGLTAGYLYRTNGDPDTVCVVH